MRRWLAAPLFKAACIFSGLLLLNELFTNFRGFYELLGKSLLTKSIANEFESTFRTVAAHLCGWLLLMALLTTAVGSVWALISCAAYREVKKRYGKIRAVGVLYWILNALTFFNLYYLAHNALFPISRLNYSPIALVVGVVNENQFFLSPALWLTIVSIPCAFLIFKLAITQSRKLAFRLSAGLICLIVVFSAYSWLTAPGEIKTFSQNDNVILMGLDSYQLNRLAAGGASRDISPRVNAFLEKCYRFDNAWTPMARTHASWMSVFTGRYPVRHGLRFNLTPPAYFNSDNRYIGDIFSEHGYFSFWAIDEVRFSNIDETYGFDRVFHPKMGLEDWLIGGVFDFSSVNLLRQTHLGHDIFTVLKNNRAAAGFNPAIWVRNFKKELNRLPDDRPLFIAFHLCGNHWPFSSPAPFCYMGRDEVEDCIRMVDWQAGRILDYFEQSGLMETSTIVMLSDHGDGWSGNLLDRANTHGADFDHLWSNKAILGIHRPGLEPGVSMELVRTLDIYPTVLEIAELPVPAGIDGQSLLPIIEGQAVPPRTVYAETGIKLTSANLKSLVDEYVGCYQIDPQTLRVSLRPEGIDWLMDLKSYMLIENDAVLIADPFKRNCLFKGFDREIGMDIDEMPDLSEREKIEMLSRLIDHYQLDFQTVFESAFNSGALGRKNANSAIANSNSR